MISGDKISLHERRVDDINFVLVTHPDATAIRANVILPFRVNPILLGDMPHETPHLLEHIVCCGDGASTTEEYNEFMANQGGNTNAFTQMTINGRLNFETSQPDNATDKVLQMFRSVFKPSLRDADTAEQKEIVRNELQGYLAKLDRQRLVIKDFEQGTRYVTDELGLSTLDEITGDMAGNFHEEVFNRNNARIILSGSEHLLKQLAEEIAEGMKDVPNGERVYAANGDAIDLPDYHAFVAGFPFGMTEYSHTLVSKGEFDGNLTKSELFVASSALIDFIKNGRNGLSAQSRNRGLSYGTQAYLGLGKNEIGITVADTTDVLKVPQQLQLLEEIMHRAGSYDDAAYEEFRAKQLGQRRMYPIGLFEFAASIESIYGYDDSPEIATPASVNQAYESMSPSRVIDIVQQSVRRLQQPTFVNRTAFGANPF